MTHPKIMLILTENWTDERHLCPHRSIPPQLKRGFNTICVKPNQFIDDDAHNVTKRTEKAHGNLSQPIPCAL